MASLSARIVSSFGIPDTSATVEHGGALVTDGTNIYALRGNKKKDFWEFNVSGGTWSSSADTPFNVEDGGALVYLSGSVYAIRGDDKTTFWKITP